LHEIEYATTPGMHDIIIVNDNLDKAFDAFEKVALGDSSPVDALPEFTD
jgi:guanylate kinase